jgi:hypothetical protein
MSASTLLTELEILPSLKGRDSYWFHAKARIPLMGSGHDGLASPEDDVPAREASPASLIFTGDTNQRTAAVGGFPGHSASTRMGSLAVST